MIKKAIALTLMVLLTLASVSAQGEELPKPGILPGSALYGLDKAIEKVQLALTFSIAAKAERRLAVAMERLAELEAVAGNPELELEAVEGLDEAADGLEEGTDALPPAIRSRIIEKFRLHLEEFKARAEKLPEAAQSGINTAISSQEEVLARMETNLPKGLQGIETEKSGATGGREKG